MNFQSIVDQVPDYKNFLAVEELDGSSRKLAEEFPGVVTLFEAGTSRGGHPIFAIKIGDGPKKALCFASPRPNKPIGAMML